MHVPNNEFFTTSILWSSVSLSLLPCRIVPYRALFSIPGLAVEVLSCGTMSVESNQIKANRSKLLDVENECRQCFPRPLFIYMYLEAIKLSIPLTWN
mmetsp:Transcript_34798/g.40011  ORF Transcript_34798/g.40011 Transcript_34798/m.40011 type:complete len:97 (+) Transcript_34798:103-393(+)